MDYKYRFPAGYFTMDDRIIDIMNTEEGKKALEGFFGPMMQHERFRLMERMPIGACLKYGASSFPPDKCNTLSELLNKIPKAESGEI